MLQTLLRSCLRWIALYFVIAALLAALAYARYPVLPVAIGAGLVAAILVWWGMAYMLSAIFGKGDDARLIRKAMQGGRPEDGEKVAVPGTVTGGFETFEAPISRKRAVAYEYKVLPYGREQAGVYDGFALAPMTIDGPRGSIRVLATPELSFPHERLTTPEHRRNLEDYVARTQWTEHAGIDIKRELDHLKTVLADDDGRIRYDIRRDMPAGEAPSRFEIREKVIAPGERVVAIGWYSSSRGGLVPRAGELYSVKILKGDVDEVLRGTKSSGFGHILLGCGCMTPVLIAAIALLSLIPLAAIEQMRPEKDPSWTEVRMERWIEKNVRQRFAPLRPDGEVAIVLVPGEARGRLDRIRLVRATATRSGDAIELTLHDDSAPRVVIRFRDLRVESTQPALADVEVGQLSVDEQQIIGRITSLSKERNLRVQFRARIE